MSRLSKILLLLTIVLVSFVVYGVYNFIYTWKNIPEAYAAWDTGTLLIEYLKSHNDQWPSGWDELLSVIDDRSEQQFAFRGAQSGQASQADYARSLQDMVAVDWSFDPSQVGTKPTGTRKDGSTFPIVREHAEPNEMIREYLNNRPQIQIAR